ncbi:D-alanyl-D-alanine carboxypeptidase family protein [Porcipelethomonas sp.]|uniref:D-alanyl-D-alanine carboxypeptidase family protein n=1 Tax=Porcipelethomonas sp. TaxID=2981675 RepID=UPI003EF1207A
MKKFISVLSAMLIGIYISASNICDAISFTPPFDVNSQSAYIINLDTKSVVYEKNADAEQMPASLVDIMTAVVVLENCEDPDSVTITADKSLYAEFEEYEYPDDLRYAEIWDGDTFTVTDYLYALMLTSSCEAANILANYFGNQNISAFVDKMNQKAKEIGAENTVFTNPHGLYDPKQVSTAKDMALITEYALTVPGFEDIATTEEYEVKPLSYTTAHEEEWTWSHSNIMMSAASDYYVYGVKGIKTGNLQLGGRNLITMASSDGIKYLLVLMNAPFYDENGDSKYYHLIDACNLIEWVFDNFNYQVLLSKDEEIAEIKVEDSDGSGYVLVKPKEELSTLWYNDIDTTSIQKNIKLADSVTAPVKKGEKLGEIELKLSDEVIAKVDLVAADNVDRSFIKFNLSMAKSFFSNKWFKRAMIISSIISLLYLCICIWAYTDAKNRANGSFSNKKIVKKLYGGKRK